MWGGFMWAWELTGSSTVLKEPKTRERRPCGRATFDRIQIPHRMQHRYLMCKKLRGWAWDYKSAPTLRSVAAPPASSKILMWALLEGSKIWALLPADL